MMHIERNGQYSSYWCYWCVRCSFVLSLFIDIDSEMRHWHWHWHYIHTHTHTLSIAPPPPPPPSLSFVPSLPSSLPPSSFFRSFVVIYSNQSLIHTLLIIHRTINWSISVHSFLLSFFRSIVEWTPFHRLIDQADTHTLNTQLLLLTDCQLCTVLYESERVWCELIAL